MKRSAAEYLPDACKPLLAGAPVPDACGLPALAAACQRCRGCDRFEHATQAVFGAGDPHARLMLVGEVPGNLGGKEFRITRERGVWHEAAGRRMLATWHPSAVLRAPEREDRHCMRAELLDDVRRVAEELGRAGGAPGDSNRADSVNPGLPGR